MTIFSSLLSTVTTEEGEEKHIMTKWEGAHTLLELIITSIHKYNAPSVQSIIQNESSSALAIYQSMVEYSVV